MRGIATALTVIALVCSGCASVTPAPAPAPVPEPLVFTGKLDLSGQGVGFLITHPSGLSCAGRYASGHLPDPVSVEIVCSDKQTGTLTVTKTPTMRGDVALSDGRKGIVTFEPLPATHPAPVVSTVRTGCGSRGGPGYRFPNGQCASWRDYHRKVDAPKPSSAGKSKHRKGGGCGSLGGPGYRLPNGKCASWHH
jgi:hypothetical protein